MTVQELRWNLRNYDDHCLVIIGKDREGNDHSPLDGIQPARYVAETTWSGQIDTAKDAPGDDCIVLYPVN